MPGGFWPSSASKNIYGMRIFLWQKELQVMSHTFPPQCLPLRALLLFLPPGSLLVRDASAVFLPKTQSPNPLIRRDLLLNNWPVICKSIKVTQVRESVRAHARLKETRETRRPDATHMLTQCRLSEGSEARGRKVSKLIPRW